MTGKREVILRDGTRGIVRAINPEDRESFVTAFEALSSESRFRRFFFNKRTLSESEISKLANPDGIDHIAYGVAALDDDGTEIPISVGHCFRQPDEPDLGEIAVVTSDLWQGNGAGGELVKSLAAACREVGISRWVAVMLAENSAMRRILNAYGEKCEEQVVSRGVIEEIYQIREVPGA